MFQSDEIVSMRSRLYGEEKQERKEVNENKFVLKYEIGKELLLIEYSMGDIQMKKNGFEEIFQSFKDDYQQFKNDNYKRNSYDKERHFLEDEVYIILIYRLSYSKYKVSERKNEYSLQTYLDEMDPSNVLLIDYPCSLSTESRSIHQIIEIIDPIHYKPIQNNTINMNRKISIFDEFCQNPSKIIINDDSHSFSLFPPFPSDSYVLSSSSILKTPKEEDGIFKDFISDSVLSSYASKSRTNSLHLTSILHPSITFDSLDVLDG